MIRQVRLEYLWLDGNDSKELRSKVRYHRVNVENMQTEPPIDTLIEQIPDWNYDGSSTNQADPENSDLILRPVRVFKNPFMPFNPRGSGTPAYYVLCEVYNRDGTPHESNTRAKLRETFDNVSGSGSMFFSVEQEFVFWDPDNECPSGWYNNSKKEYKTPKPQGSYYCGNGSYNVTHRPIIDQHVHLCQGAGLAYEGNNAEVMKSQWEYQLSPLDAIDGADSLWLSRFLLQRVCELRNLDVNFHPKPVDGDWNGSGAHVNFSTHEMRTGPKEVIDATLNALSESHEEAISLYGEHNNLRLTGKHETSSMSSFTYGDSDRTASIRIPTFTQENGFGYLEDRRPASNMDPYVVYEYLLRTVEGVIPKDAEDTTTEVQESEE